MKTTIVLFTYRGEEELLPLQASHLAKVLPFASIHIVDDAHDPIPASLATHLSTLHPRLHYKKSFFDRGGNLNGGECIMGMLEAMQQAADLDQNTEGIIIKLDPDTLMLRPQFIIDHLSKGASWYASSSVDGMFSGMCYALTRPTLDKVKKIALRMPWEINTEERSYPEDMSICSMAVLASGRAPHLHVNLSAPNNNSIIGAFDVRSHDDAERYEKAVKAATRSYIVTVGNTGVNGLPRAYRVKFMHDILHQFHNQQKSHTQ